MIGRLRPDPDRERKQQMALALRELVKTPEWKVFEGCILAGVNQRIEKLVTADLDEVQTIQGELRGLNYALFLPQTFNDEVKKL